MTNAQGRLGPLADVRVLDMSRLHPGAFCTLVLADLGADVIKIEPPGGDPMRYAGASSPGNVALNRGKRSLALDLKNPASAEIVRRLVADADVLVESQRPGAMARLGLSYESLAEINPGLVWCSITGFGDGSPYQEQAAHDVTLLGYSGLLSSIAGDSVYGSPQLVIAVPIGGLMAATGIMAALRERDRTGRGSRVDASLLDSATWILGEQIAAAGQGLPTKYGDQAARRSYRCSDGELITLAAVEPRTWQALVTGLGLPELADKMPRTPEENQIVFRRFEAIFAERTAAEWLAQLGGAGSAIGAVNTAEQLLDDPHMRQRESIVEVGGHRVLASPLRIAGLSGPVTQTATHPAPELGGDSEAVLSAAGYSDAEIAQFRSDGVLPAT
ncbi:CaiB/BaiF CoA transferase family protein [Jatrophihabitans sp. DSM 45814]